MDAELLVLIWNRICGYTGRFFHVDGGEIVETGDWMKEEEKRYSLYEAERWLAVDLYCKRVVNEMELQPIEDRIKRIDKYIAQLGPVGKAMLAEHKEFMEGEKGETETGDPP